MTTTILDMRAAPAAPLVLPSTNTADVRVERVAGDASARLCDVLPESNPLPLLAFLEPGDTWFSDKLKRQIRLHENHPELGWSLTNHEHIVADGYTLNFLPGTAREKLRTRGQLPCFFETLPWNRIDTLSGLMVRRELLEHIPDFDLAVRPTRALECVLQIARRFPSLAYLPEPLYRTKPSNGDDPWSDNWELIFGCLRRAIVQTELQFGARHGHLCCFTRGQAFEALLSDTCSGGRIATGKLGTLAHQLGLSRSRRALLRLVQLLPRMWQRRVQDHVLVWHRTEHVSYCNDHA